MMMRNRFILLALLCCVPHTRAQDPLPLWKTDLAKFGYQGRPPAAIARLPQEALNEFGITIYRQGVAFTDANVVVAYFVVHDDPPGATGLRAPLLSDPFRLVALFLNVRDGEVTKKLEWPLPADPQDNSSAFFSPAGDGRFLVGLGKTLNLYSPEFKLLAHIDRPLELSLIVSPSGNSLLLRTDNEVDGQWITRYELRETRNLSVLKSWTEASTRPPHSITSLWDDRLAWTSRSSLYFKTPTATTNELLANQGELCGNWNFISKEALAGAVCGDTHKLITVSTEAKVTGQFALGFEQLDGPVVASASGQRFAVSTFRWGAGDKDPESLTARVFGPKLEIPLLTLNISQAHETGVNFFTEEGDTRFGWGGLALSPDGELLAVKSGATVQLYRVTGPGGSTNCGVTCGNEVNLAGPKPASPQTVPGPRPSPQLIEQVLSWLPADTETVAGATGPLLLPKMEQDADGNLSMVKSEHPVQDTFKQFQLLPLLALAKHFANQPIVAAIEGSRDFRSPAGLGMMKSQGSAIAVFAGDITASASSFLKDPASAIVRTDQIEGHAVAVLQGKSEEDLWTTYVAFPKPNVAVVATDKDYLREVLARMDGKKAERALPDTLVEWKHVSTHAQFWAVRHYRRIGAEKDPTSPFGHCPGSTPDDNAIGLTFSFDTEKSATATVTYLSADENSLQRFQKTYFAEHGPALTEMHVRYREPEPGAVEGSYDLDQIESASYFVFVLEALLGHAIYL